MPLSRYLQRALLNHAQKGTSYTQPTNIYVALYTAAPSDIGGGTEASGTGYARVVCNSWVAASDASPSITSNTSTIDFGTAGASWGTITHFALLDASSGGNLLWWGALTTSKAVASGDPVSFAANALQLTLD